MSRELLSGPGLPVPMVNGAVPDADTSGETRSADDYDPAVRDSRPPDRRPGFFRIAPTWRIR